VTEPVIDPITLATVWHGLQSTCREMRELVSRTAQSHIMSRLGDFSAGIWDRSGQTVAVPIGLPHQFLGGKHTVQYILKDIGAERMAPGDIYLNNDPYHGGNSHLPDWGFFRPIFYKGELLFFTLARGHMMDTGGSYPGGYFPNGYDIHAEGLCFPPTKVYENDQPREEMWKLIWNNVRFPDAMKIDVNALVASTRLCERRIVRLLDRYGRDTVMGSIDEMIGRTERAIRAEIAKIPDGTYSGESSTDDDGTRENVPVTVRVDITVKDDSIAVDYSRSDPQQKGFINHPWVTTYSRSAATMFLFLDPSLADYHNEGSLRPLSVIAPEGSIVNPRYPATVGGSPVSVGQMVVEALAQAMSKAVPDRAAASWARRSGHYMIGRDPRTGDHYVWCPFDSDGGAGAVRGYDGHQGPAASMSVLGNVQRSDVEEAEIRFPWRYDRYEFAPDRMGHGRWRGAPGMIWQITNLGDECVLPTGNSDGERTIAPAAAGGTSAPMLQAYLIRDGERLPFHTHRLYHGRKGDSILKITGGGAGVGDPRERPLELVEEDLRNGFISGEVARDVYGAVVEPGTLRVVGRDAASVGAAER
jgi:N-methylhydantoinase B